MSDQTSGESILRRHTQNVLFQSDVLAVYDYLHIYRSGSLRAPEVRLMAAVLQDAIDCYVKNLYAKTRQGKQIFAEVEEWFFSSDEDWLFAFGNICGVLDLEPDYLRRCLLRFKQTTKAQDLSRGHRIWNLPGARLRFAS